MRQYPCAEGDTGFVYSGQLEFEITRTDLDQMPEIPFKISMNIGNPERAFSLSRIPNAGVGLARLEFNYKQHHRHPSQRPVRDRQHT